MFINVSSRIDLAIRSALLAALVPLLVANLSYVPAASAESAEIPDDAPLVFLDCDRCDFSYVRVEIPYVNWVRDREDAIVHVLVTDQRTGSGGREYTLDFIGLKGHSGTDQKLNYLAPPDYTEDEVREGLTGILKVGLLPYLEWPLIGKLSVSFEGEEAEKPSAPVTDTWDSWVFEIEASGEVDKEATRTELAAEAALSADRVTEMWRLRTWTSVEYEEDRFESGGSGTSTSSSHEWAFWGMIARSLGPHWSLGGYAQVYSDTYDNTDFGLRITPALEYSLWDYDETQRRSVTLTYTVGQRSVDYVDETIFGETEETRFDQALDIDLRLNQPWGAVRASLEGSHYFHDFNRYRVELFSRLSVRLFRGLSLIFSGRIERINDQLGLRKGDASLEEILLRRRELATDYEIRGRVGLSYTFGSIYNNVVNTRL